jgi:hypothetical protein
LHSSNIYLRIKVNATKRYHYILQIIGKAILIVLIFSPFFSYSQPKKQGTIEYLKFTNGFNGIKLGADLQHLPDYKLAFLDGDNQFDADSCLMFAYEDPDLLKLDSNLNVQLIGLRTYKDKVVNIYIFFKLSDGYKMLHNFLTNYGLFTSKPSDYVDIYNWTSSKINLSLRYEVKVDLGVAIFTCNDLEDEIAKMKERQLIALFACY